MNQIFPKKNELMSRLKDIKATLNKLNNERDNTFRMSSLLEKELFIIQKLLELEIEINNELVESKPLL